MKRLSALMKFSKATVALLSLAVVIPIALVDIGDAVFPNILYFALVCPAVFAAILIVALVKRQSPLFVTGALYLAISLVCFQGRSFLRYHERWLTHPEPYRSHVLSQPSEKNGLRHVVWDDWGGFGAPPTLTYLVYDQDEKLSRQRLKGGGAVPGVPCDVWFIHRLNSRWYSLTFYTGSFWETCSY